MHADQLVEIQLNNPDDFLKVKETLTRIGVASRKEQILYQSCHILHKKGKYYIVHFKEMFLLDGKSASLSESDIGRRNTIIGLLQDWELVKVVDNATIAAPIAAMNQIKIVAFKDKKDWQLVPKYSIGKK